MLFNWPNHEEWSDQFEYNDFFVTNDEDGSFSWDSFTPVQDGYRRYRVYYAEPEELEKHAWVSTARETGSWMMEMIMLVPARHFNYEWRTCDEQGDFFL